MHGGQKSVDSETCGVWTDQYMNPTKAVDPHSKIVRFFSNFAQFISRYLLIPNCDLLK